MLMMNDDICIIAMLCWVIVCVINSMHISITSIIGKICYFIIEGFGIGDCMSCFHTMVYYIRFRAMTSLACSLLLIEFVRVHV